MQMLRVTIIKRGGNMCCKVEESTGRYCIYLRKSREDREAEKYNDMDTLSRHRTTLLQFAEANNMRIEHIYKEVASRRNN